MMLSKHTMENKPEPTIGYTTRYHLLLDLDNTTLEKTRMLTRMIQKQWHKVGDTLILLSSNRAYQELLIHRPMRLPMLVRRLSNYHLVFDNLVGYNFSCKLIKVIAYLGILNRDYIKIRLFRGDMTLRCSPVVLINSIKPVPRIVDYIHNPYVKKSDGYIWDYIKFLHAVTSLYPNFP